ncbi:MAG: methyltransferase domain-containing protein [Candidatus Binatus sp.]|jgi:predicted SAM-dependent methyltransferase
MASFNSAKEYLKTHTSRGLRDAVRKAAQEWQLARLHRASLKKVGPFMLGPENKLNLGCGPNSKEGWINVDVYDLRADFQLDLRETWPFPDASISHVYSEHVFEHFEFRGEVPHFLSEARRVLKSGGLFDVGVPDTEWPLHAYGDSTDPYWPFSKTVHPEWCETQLDHINYHFRQEAEHKYAWDYETLAGILRRFGFINVTRREFDPALDTESRKIGTLYIRAINP